MVPKQNTRQKNVRRRRRALMRGVFLYGGRGVMDWRVKFDFVFGGEREGKRQEEL